MYYRHIHVHVDPFRNEITMQGIFCSSLWKVKKIWMRFWMNHDHDRETDLPVATLQTAWTLVLWIWKKMKRTHVQVHVNVYTVFAWDMKQQRKWNNCKWLCNKVSVWVLLTIIHHSSISIFFFFFFFPFFILTIGFFALSIRPFVSYVFTCYSVLMSFCNGNGMHWKKMKRFGQGGNSKQRKGTK